MNLHPLGEEIRSGRVVRFLDEREDRSCRSHHRLLAGEKPSHHLDSFHEFAALTAIPEDDDRPDAVEMMRRLLAGQETVVRTARSIFPLVEKANDAPTADLLTQRMQVHEKTAWMLRSLLA